MLLDLARATCLGAFADGTSRKCMSDDHCVNLGWPEMWAGYARPKWERSWWHGTLLEDKADASGLNYRRNRYYDPVNGRFTQEDPIGLAGGLNVYGFAAGDPVTYSDPYGLCAQASGDTIPEIGFCQVPLSQGVDDVSVGIFLTVVPTGRVYSAARPLLARLGTGLAAVLGRRAVINVTQRGSNHVIARHTVGGAESAGKSLFNAGENVAGLIQAASSVTPTRQAGRQPLQRVVNAGRPIGVDRTTNSATSVYTVDYDQIGGPGNSIPRPTLSLMMSISVYLVNETGAIVDGPVHDPTNILGRLLPNPEEDPGSHLAYIDPYGNTIFNGLQAQRFLFDWESLPRRPVDAAEQLVLETIQLMAVRSVEEPHLYLKFVGD